MTDEQYRTLAAAMERVLPSERGPGAADANAAVYARWAADRYESVERSLSAGLTLLESLAAGMWGRGFSACDGPEKDAVLERLQGTPHPTAQRFFRTLVRVTLAGFLSAPAYGGNRNGVGWSFLGFEPHPLTFGAAEVRREA